MLAMAFFWLRSYGLLTMCLVQDVRRSTRHAQGMARAFRNRACVVAQPAMVEVTAAQVFVSLNPEPPARSPQQCTMPRPSAMCQVSRLLTPFFSLQSVHITRRRKDMTVVAQKELSAIQPLKKHRCASLSGAGLQC
jgi:hypothetical protein